MIGAICKEANNWFDKDRVFGTFAIVGGTFPVEAPDGQYVRIVGSVFNDGVHKLPLSGLTDETFDGAVWLMAPPPEFLQLVTEIEGWQGKNGEAFSGPYSSESFGGYTYSKKAAQDGSEYGWKDAFASKLNRWRKL